MAAGSRSTEVGIFASWHPCAFAVLPRVSVAGGDAAVRGACGVTAEADGADGWYPHEKGGGAGGGCGGASAAAGVG